jgi:transcriptional regulator with XRE-family HTH domain
MDSRAQIGEFLRSRRARITPEAVGLPAGATLRRVPGLRREEVALLAGVSVDYYIRLERGQTRGVSEGVLTAVARALLLDETEQAHLVDLARPVLSRRPRRLPAQRVRPGLLRALELIDAPAVVQGRRLDVLATNRLYRAVLTDFDAVPARERNIARFVFLDDRSPELYVDWEKAAVDVVAALQRYSARRPDDPQLAELVGELSVRSPLFRRAWADQDVKVYTTGVKVLRHPLVGELSVAYENLTLTEDPEQALVIYHADKGSRSQEAIDLIDSWSLSPATPSPVADPSESTR